MFIHRFKLDGVEACGRAHVRVAEARDCEVEAEEALHSWEGPSCSLCDGLGHGYPGGGPCPLEERGYWDAEAERDWEAACGVLSYEEARDLAMA